MKKKNQNINNNIFICKRCLCSKIVFPLITLMFSIYKLYKKKSFCYAIKACMRLKKFVVIVKSVKPLAESNGKFLENIEIY